MYRVAPESCGGKDKPIKLFADTKFLEAQGKGLEIRTEETEVATSTFGQNMLAVFF